MLLLMRTVTADRFYNHPPAFTVYAYVPHYSQHLDNVAVFIVFAYVDYINLSSLHRLLLLLKRLDPV